MVSILRASGAAGAALVATLAVGTAAHAEGPGTTVRVSVRSDGSQSQGTAGSREPSISADGRYVVFGSGDQLAGNDTNADKDVYLHDTVTGTTELISVGPDGVSVTGASDFPKVSADGRYVAFTSRAPLTPGSDFSGGTFMRDRLTGTTTRIGPAGVLFEGPDMTPDGTFVAFAVLADSVPEDRNGSNDIYVWNRRTGQLTVASIQADGTTSFGNSGSPTISDNGRFVTYRTSASALNGGVFGARVVVSDRAFRTTKIVSPLVDPDGGDVGAPVISGDGNFVAYSQNDTGSATDVKLWQRTTGTTTTASVSVAGRTGTGVSLSPRISGTGQYVAFWSSARDLVAAAPSAPMSVYRFDRQTGRNVVAMTPPDDAFFGSEQCDISDDGRFVATETTSATLVPGDTNGEFDVFRTQVS